MPCTDDPVNRETPGGSSDDDDESMGFVDDIGMRRLSFRGNPDTQYLTNGSPNPTPSSCVKVSFPT